MIIKIIQHIEPYLEIARFCLKDGVQIAGVLKDEALVLLAGGLRRVARRRHLPALVPASQDRTPLQKKSGKVKREKQFRSDKGAAPTIFLRLSRGRIPVPPIVKKAFKSGRHHVSQQFQQICSSLTLDRLDPCLTRSPKSVRTCMQDDETVSRTELQSVSVVPSLQCL